MPDTITREQAEKALAAIKLQFRNYLDDTDQPTLFEPGTQCSGWAIGWEAGPYEWTYRAFQGGFDEEMHQLAREFVDDTEAHRMATDRGTPCPDGVFAEPVNTWCLGLYPA